jgi:hypothetical protein
VACGGQVGKWSQAAAVTYGLEVVALLGIFFFFFFFWVKQAFRDLLNLKGLFCFLEWGHYHGPAGHFIFWSLATLVSSFSMVLFQIL